MAAVMRRAVLALVDLQLNPGGLARYRIGGVRSQGGV